MVKTTVGIIFVIHLFYYVLFIALLEFSSLYGVCAILHASKKLNPIVVGLFDITILVGGGAKKPPPYLTLDW